MIARLSLLFLIMLVACANPADDELQSDAGPRDAGGTRDAGDTRDAGTVDTGITDTGITDTGIRDTGIRDAGERDAGERDAGERDAGRPDTGCALVARVGNATRFTGPAPIAYYTFDDTHRAGTTVLDEAGAPYDATPNAAAQTGLGIAGQVGQAIRLDGTSALVTADPPKTNTLTLSFWLRPRVWPANERKVIVNLGNGPSAWQGYGAAIRPTGVVIGFVEGGGSLTNEHVAATNSCVNTDDWTHVTVTMDGAQIRTYQNGVLQTTTPTNLSTISFGTAPLVVGYHSFFQNAYYDGDLDELALWDVALPETDIEQVYFAGRDGAPTISRSPPPRAER